MFNFANQIQLEQAYLPWPTILLQVEILWSVFDLTPFPTALTRSIMIEKKNFKKKIKKRSRAKKPMPRDLDSVLN